MTPTKNCLSIMFFVILYSLLMINCEGAEYSDTQIVNAIYKAENSKKYPYGIISIDTKGNETYARKICFNTVRNNRKRYADYGYKKYDTYLDFLASRYCPTEGKNLTNDEKRLNVYWLGNVKYFLEKQRGKDANRN